MYGIVADLVKCRCQWICSYFQQNSEVISLIFLFWSMTFTFEVIRKGLCVSMFIEGHSSSRKWSFCCQKLQQFVLEGLSHLAEAAHPLSLQKWWEEIFSFSILMMTWNELLRYVMQTHYYCTFRGYFCWISFDCFVGLLKQRLVIHSEALIELMEDGQHFLLLIRELTDLIFCGHLFYPLLLGNIVSGWILMNNFVLYIAFKV